MTAALQLRPALLRLGLDEELGRLHAATEAGGRRAREGAVPEAA